MENNSNIFYSNNIKKELKTFKNYLKFSSNGELHIGNPDWIIIDTSEKKYHTLINEIKSIANIYNKSVNAETEDEHRRNMFRTENKKTVALDDIQVSIITKLDEDEPIKYYKEKAMFFANLDDEKSVNKKRQINKIISEHGLQLSDDCSISSLLQISENEIENELARIIMRAFSENSKIITNKYICSDRNNLDYYMAQLNGLIGLSQAKKTILEIINYLLILQKRNIDNKPTLHMAFLGNSGTGKTTVAELVGKILSQYGLLSPNAPFIKVSREDIVAKYVGHTEAQLMKIIDEAQGGILFIDEAYSLNDNNFGKSAIDVMVKQLDLHRNDLCVILAGYTNEMLEFLQSNPGLGSRIAFQIKFEDYSENELLDIFLKFAKDERYVMQKGCNDILLQEFGKIRNKKNSGNGRFVRNLYERVKIIQANRVIVDDGNINYIKIDDITEAIEQMKSIEEERPQLGFSSSRSESN